MWLWMWGHHIGSLVLSLKKNYIDNQICTRCKGGCYVFKTKRKKKNEVSTPLGCTGVGHLHFYFRVKISIFKLRCCNDDTR